MVSSRSLALRGEGLQERGNALGANNGDAGSIDEHDVNQQPSSSSWSRSEPSSLISSSSTVAGIITDVSPAPSSTRPDSSCDPYSASPPARRSGSADRAAQANGHHLPVISNLAADEEERYEAFGVNDDAASSDSPQGSGSPAASPIAGANPHRKPRSPNSMPLNRHSWLRTSLGRSQAGASRKRLSSNALASQLYRSSSFNSSGRGSICDTADDVYSDISLEDDVIDLNQRVQMIQEQMHALVDTQSAGEERYARVKQENATLQARILMLEESARDAEARAEEKFDAEQRRHREWASRLEREKELQLENLAIKLQAAEQESTRAKDESTRLREQLDKLKNEKARLESSLDEAHQDVERAKEAERRAGLTLADATRQLKRVEEELAQKLELERRMEELAEEMKSLRIHNKKLEESRDELQAAAAALQAGRELLLSGGQDPNDNTISRKNSPSLATELLLTGSAHDQADGIDTGKSATAIDICDNISTLAEAKKALREQREVNAALRAYIDNILLNIVENYPQLLEVKQPH